MVNPEGTREKSEELLGKVRALMPEFTRLDGTINYAGLSRAIGKDRTTVRHYCDHILAQHRNAAQQAYTPDLAVAEKIEEVQFKVRVRAYNPNITKDHPSRRTVFIGDTHVQPGLDNRHFTWIGRYVAETQPDNVVHAGDFGEWESCEFHSAPGSASHAKRPAFIDDVESCYDALELYHKEVPLGSIPHDIVHGNHEYRIERYEEAAPSLAGTLILQREQMFARYRWRTTPYRHYLFFEGVGMTHVPQTVMQKPYGGKFPENLIAADLTHSLVFAHTHRFNHVTRPKIGINNSITVTNVGSAMPHGYVPKYADGATTGLTYGIVELRLHGGRVESPKFISMLELAEKYG